MLTIERDSQGEFQITISEPGTGTRKRSFRAYGRDQVFEAIDHYFRPQGVPSPHINGLHDEICPLCMGK